MAIARVYIEGELQEEFDIEPGYYVDVTYRGKTARLRGGDKVNFYDPERNAFSDMTGPVEATGNLAKSLRNSVRSILPW